MKWDWTEKSLKVFWGIIFALLLICLLIGALINTLY